MSVTADILRKKVARANDHFSCFESALGLSGSPIDRTHTGAVHVNGEGRLEFTTDLAIPGAEHGIIFGDVVHQLRTCLDHIAYAMVRPRCTDRNVLRKVQFPIFDRPAKLRDNPRFHVLIKVFGEPSDEITASRESQPYERNPAFPTADALWIVSELDNIDKHRTILVINPSVTVWGDVSSPSGRRGFRAHKQPIKAGTAQLDIGWPLPGAPIEVNVEGAHQLIVLSETDGLCDNLSVYGLVNKMTDAVNGIIDGFESKSLI